MLRLADGFGLGLVTRLVEDLAFGWSAAWLTERFPEEAEGRLRMTGGTRR